MIKQKTPEEIEIMREGGKIAVDALKLSLNAVKEGVTTRYLDQMVDDFILSNRAQCAFKLVSGYSFATCININQGLVHGIPNDYKIKTGDLVSIDLGVFYKGFNTDLSYTIEAGTNNEDKFLQAGKQALLAAITACEVGNHIGDVSHAMQAIVEAQGYSVSRELVGHGIGRKLHEDPYVPGYGSKGQGQVLKDGYVLAIEIIYQKGSPRIKILKDNWTIETYDGSLGGLFEQTVAITRNGPIVITPFDLD